MDLKFWTWSLFKNADELRTKNKELVNTLDDASLLLHSLEHTITHMGVQHERFKADMAQILAAVALQNGGQVVINKDFLEMALKKQLTVNFKPDGSAEIIILNNNEAQLESQPKYSAENEE
jgi:hypothetical protein